MAAIDLDALRERFGYQPLLLGVVALIASSALAVVSSATHEAIAEAEAADLRRSLAEVLPEGFSDNNLLDERIELQRAGKPVVVYRARKGGVVKGVVFAVAERGYAADIHVLMAVDVEGRALGVRVLKHAETPGLGDKIEIARHDWIRSFEGRSLADPTPDKWGVKKDGGVFDQFAGATITPRAVVKAVKDGLGFFAEQRVAMLGEAS